jgi:hypothetical protein
LVISALQKAVRRSQPTSAAGHAIELVRSGYGAWCWARLKVIAVEDCNPEHGTIADLEALSAQWKAAKGEGDLHLLAPARAAVTLALAPKSRLVDWLVILHADRRTEPVPIPDEAKDMHTREGRRLGRGRQHFADEAGRLVPFDGDLAELEADVRVRALAVWLAEKPAQNSDRPTAGTPAEPAQNSDIREFGQLRMTGDTQEDR